MVNLSNLYPDQAKQKLHLTICQKARWKIPTLVNVWQYMQLKFTKRKIRREAIGRSTQSDDPTQKHCNLRNLTITLPLYKK